MDIDTATTDYERWLRRSLTPVRDDLVRKHELMRRDRFSFFRATFYRWAQHWPTLAKPVRNAPAVLAIGDAHVENFGTWRDAEGRLVWGTNDFDEAARLPYTQDLVRLAASAVLAHAEGQLLIATDRIHAAILLGYTSALRHAGSPVVLDGANRWLREMALGALRDPEAFWGGLLHLPRWRKPVPERVESLLSARTKGARLLRIVHRSSGAGSLGRPRYAAIHLVDGGYIAREAKARAPSAWHWAHDDGAAPNRDPLPGIWRAAVRSQDPFLRVTRRWSLRRLAPDCARIDLASIPKRRKEAALLAVMGWEIANVHLGSGAAKAVQAHLATLPRAWLATAAEAMLDPIERDYRQWKRRQ